MHENNRGEFSSRAGRHDQISCYPAAFGTLIRNIVNANAVFVFDSNLFHIKWKSYGRKRTSGVTHEWIWTERRRRRTQQ